MRSQSDIPTRLARVKKDLEAIAWGQRYHFGSLISKRSVASGTSDLSASVGAGSETTYRVTATPASGKLLPLNLEVRHRVGNADVLADPGTNSNARFIAPNRNPPTADGVHVLDFRYYTATAETVYFKAIATGMDDYTLTVTTI